MKISDLVFRANSAKKRRISGYLTLFLQENARKTGRKDACMTFRVDSWNSLQEFMKNPGGGIQRDSPFIIPELECVMGYRGQKIVIFVPCKIC